MVALPYVFFLHFLFFIFFFFFYLFCYSFHDQIKHLRINIFHEISWMTVTILVALVSCNYTYSPNMTIRNDWKHFENIRCSINTISRQSAAHLNGIWSGIKCYFKLLFAIINLDTFLAFWVSDSWNVLYWNPIFIPNYITLNSS